MNHWLVNTQRFVHVNIPICCCNFITKGETCTKIAKTRASAKTRETGSAAAERTGAAH